MEVKTSTAFNELINYLVSKEFAVIVDGKAVLTSKFYEVFPPQNTEKIVYDGSVNIQFVEKKPYLSGAVTPEEKKEIWNKFVDDSAIPHRVTAPGGGTYTVRHYSPSAVNKLLSILRNKDLDYNRLCESTKNYYKTVAYKLTLQRYLCEEVWADEYKAWSKDSVKRQPRNDGSNWAEST